MARDLLFYTNDTSEPKKIPYTNLTIDVNGNVPSVKRREERWSNPPFFFSLIDQFIMVGLISTKKMGRRKPPHISHIRARRNPKHESRHHASLHHNHHDSRKR